MTLKELHKTKYPNAPFIGVFERPEKFIYPDYADEVLETHGDKEVINYNYQEKKGVLIVKLEK